VPLLLKLINDPEYSVYYNALSALDAMLEGLQDQVQVYLPSLMARFLQLLESGDRKIRLIVTACIGSAAHAAGKEFIPYFNQVIPRLHILMQLGADKEDLDLRGVATDTVSTIAEAVGKDVFRVHFSFAVILSPLFLTCKTLASCSRIDGPLHDWLGDR
jgi:hypothetical protein